jgi:hypothetical protein
MESSQPSVLKHEWEHIREQVKEWWTDLTDADLRMSLSTVRQVGRHRWTFPSSTMKLTRSSSSRLRSAVVRPYLPALLPSPGPLTPALAWILYHLGQRKSIRNVLGVAQGRYEMAVSECRGYRGRAVKMVSCPSASLVKICTACCQSSAM